MDKEPTTEMKLAAAIEALKAFTGILRVERSDSGPDSGKLYLYYVDKEMAHRWILTEETASIGHFLEDLGEALDTARLVTGELRFP